VATDVTDLAVEILVLVVSVHLVQYLVTRTSSLWRFLAVVDQSDLAVQQKPKQGVSRLGVVTGDQDLGAGIGDQGLSAAAAKPGVQVLGAVTEVQLAGAAQVQEPAVQVHCDLVSKIFVEDLGFVIKIFVEDLALVKSKFDSNVCSPAAACPALVLSPVGWWLVICFHSQPDLIQKLSVFDFVTGGVNHIGDLHLFGSDSDLSSFIFPVASLDLFTSLVLDLIPSFPLNLGLSSEKGFCQ
jgi:hypothetical protein